MNNPTETWNAERRRDWLKTLAANDPTATLYCANHQSHEYPAAHLKENGCGECPHPGDFETIERTVES